MPSLGSRASNSDITLGLRLREYRQSRKMRLSDISSITGLSISTLSKIENGKLSLSFNKILQLSIDLSIPISTLIGPVDEPHIIGRRAFTPAGKGRRAHRPQWDAETLSDDLIKKRNIFMKLSVKCRSIEDYGPFSTHPGEEFIYVISGSMELHTELYKPLRLDVGDSIQFDSMTPHAYVALGEETPVVLMCNTISTDPLSGFDPEMA
ncbi:helix-turn-helix domain-containing protein [Mesorhizobium sp. 2RAF21]|uniref:helix-turn-helix domain-containing protein n=1 Tax=Mesorhizobium sp. 2RAF21 TaxID=3232995 RepID=UPI003F9BEC87